MSEDESKNQNINMSDENNNEQKKEIKQVTIRFKFLDKLHFPRNVEGVDRATRIGVGNGLLLLGGFKKSFLCILFGMCLTVSGLIEYSPIYHVMDIMDRSNEQFKRDQEEEKRIEQQLLKYNEIENKIESKSLDDKKIN